MMVKQNVGNYFSKNKLDAMRSEGTLNMWITSLYNNKTVK